MGELSTSEAADPAITTSEEDPARLAFESGSSAFMINYPFVYPSAKENAPDVFKVMKAAKYPAGRPEHPERAAARRDQPRRLGLLREPGPRLRGDRVPDPAREPDRDRDRRRPAAGARGPLRLEGDREGLSGLLADLIRQSIEDAAPRARRSRPPTRTSRWRSRRRSTRPPTSTPTTRRPTYDELHDKLEQAINREGLL